MVLPSVSDQLLYVTFGFKPCKRSEENEERLYLKVTLDTKHSISDILKINIINKSYYITPKITPHLHPNQQDSPLLKVKWHLTFWIRMSCGMEALKLHPWPAVELNLNSSVRHYTGSYAEALAYYSS
jgi:hypothetical protein